MRRKRYDRMIVISRGSYIRRGRTLLWMGPSKKLEKIDPKIKTTTTTTMMMLMMTMMIIVRNILLGKWECLHTGSWDPITGLPPLVSTFHYQRHPHHRHPQHHHHHHPQHHRLRHLHHSHHLHNDSLVARITNEI